jgi:hypothetical protein
MYRKEKAMPAYPHTDPTSVMPPFGVPPAKPGRRKS